MLQDFSHRHIRSLVRGLCFSALILLAPSASWGSIQFGGGLSSFNSGRTIPAITAGFTTDSVGLFATATGTRSDLFYGSHYTLSIHWLWNAGTFGDGRMRAGFGLGGFHSERGYRESTTSELQKSKDSSVGLSFGVQWNPLSFFYLRGESILGIGSIGRALALAFQDSALISMGVEVDF